MGFGTIRSLSRSAALSLLPPYRRVSQGLAAANTHIAALEEERASLHGEITALRQQMQMSRQQAGRRPEPLRIIVARGDRQWEIDPAVFETFAFRSGDKLTVVPVEEAAKLPNTWGDTHIQIAPGRAIRVPPRYDLFEFKGFRIPAHLISLTGAGPETLDWMGRKHFELYNKFVGLAPDMTVLDIGCGIGRDAFPLSGYLNESGRYIGIDVTRDSILWCQENITERFPNMTFFHFDAVNELYNPYGTKKSADFRLPVNDNSVDRIVLSSVFTHILYDEVSHYLKEFRRVLTTSGLIYASFFLYSPDALAAAQSKGTTSWKATFGFRLDDGVYGNDPVYPRGAVAFTDAAMKRLIAQAGLRLARPFLKGAWSGLHDDPDDGQDVAILQRD